MERKIERKGYTIINNGKVPNDMQDLVDKVLLKTARKKENELYGDIEILDFDLDRVYLKANDIDFIVRMWDIYETNKGYRIIWTFFKDIRDETCGNGGELSNGVSVVESEKE